MSDTERDQGVEIRFVVNLMSVVTGDVTLTYDAETKRHSVHILQEQKSVRIFRVFFDIHGHAKMDKQQSHDNIMTKFLEELRETP